MTVTDIIAVDKRRARIYIDNEIYCILYNGEIRRLKLACDEEISVCVYDEINAILYKRCRERSFYILKTRDYSEFEIRTKLCKSCFPEEIINHTLDFLKNYAYIDDTRFCQNYIQNYINSESVNKIKNKLFLKGLPRHLIEECIENYSVDPVNVIMNKYGRKIEQYHLGDDKEKRRIYNMLLRKGFTYEDINSAIKTTVRNMS